MPTHVSSREFTNFDPASWFMLVPIGTFPIDRQETDGQVRTYQQIVDNRACAEIVASFNRRRAASPDYKLLIDFEHFSHDPSKSTEAAAWGEELQARADGVWFRATWSDAGESAVRNWRYRFISPTWHPNQTENLGGNRFRPIEVNDAGLTNKPNLGDALQPFWNRAGSISIDVGQTVPLEFASAAVRHIDAIVASWHGAGAFANRVSDMMAVAEGCDEAQAITAVFTSHPHFYQAYREGLGGGNDRAYRNRAESADDTAMMNDVRALAAAEGDITPILNRFCCQLQLPTRQDRATAFSQIFNRRPSLYHHYRRAIVGAR